MISRGFSGYNTRACAHILPRVVSREDVPDIAAFVIFLGANDGTLPPSTTHVPLHEYQQNLEDMVNYLVVSTCINIMYVEVHKIKIYEL